MLHRCIAALALAPVIAMQTGAQTAGKQQPPFKNELLDNLAGRWTISAGDGPVRGEADAVWELGHQWLRLHQKEGDGPESVTYIGFDNYDRRLVAIRLDDISARGAETNGYGEVPTGNKLVLTFDYATSDIRQTWAWDPQTKSWQFTAESRARRATTWNAGRTVTLRRGPGRAGPPGFRLQPPPGPPGPPPPQ